MASSVLAELTAGEQEQGKHVVADATRRAGVARADGTGEKRRADWVAARPTSADEKPRPDQRPLLAQQRPGTQRSGT